MKKRYETFKVDQELSGMKNVTAKDVMKACEKWCKKGFNLTFAIRRFEQWFFNTHKEPYANWICTEERLNAPCIWDTLRGEILGYNVNKHVKEDHVFIEGKGTFYLWKEDAEEAEKKSINKVGGYMEEIIHNGLKLYRKQFTNVWN